MSTALRDFDAPVPLADGRRWTARFDSFDEYHEEAYFVVALLDAAGASANFVVRIDTSGITNLLAPSARDEVAAAISAVAKSGKTNTPYVPGTHPLR
jgi:hypothetical protein